MKRKPVYLAPPTLDDVTRAWSVAQPRLVERFEAMNAAAPTPRAVTARAFFQGVVVGCLVELDARRKLPRGAARALKITRAWLEFSP